MASVTAAELQKQFGRYREIARLQPLTVTHHGRDSLVILAAEEYKRLKAYDTRQSYAVDELPADILEALKQGYQGEATPELDKLMT